MSINNRVREFIKKKNISFREFADKTGMSESNVRLSKNYGSDKLERIIKAFPELNIIWLITGEGEMIINNEKQKNSADFISEPYPSYTQNTELIECQKRVIELQDEIRKLEKELFELKLEKNNIFTKLKNK